METCGLQVHTQVLTKEFSNVFIAIMKTQGGDPEVKQKTEELVGEWVDRFRGLYGNLPGFRELLEATNRPYSEVQLRSYTSPEETRARSASTVSLPATRLLRLNNDLEMIREHVSLAKEMITAAEPEDSNEALEEIMQTLREMRVRLVKVVEEVEDPEMLGGAIGGKELVDEVLEKYQMWKERRPVPEMDIFSDAFTPDVRMAASMFLPSTAYQAQPLLLDEPPKPLPESLVRKSDA